MKWSNLRAGVLATGQCDQPTQSSQPLSDLLTGPQPQKWAAEQKLVTTRRSLKTIRNDSNAGERCQADSPGDGDVWWHTQQVQHGSGAGSLVCQAGHLAVSSFHFFIKGFCFLFKRR